MVPTQNPVHFTRVMCQVSQNLHDSVKLADEVLRRVVCLIHLIVLDILGNRHLNYMRSAVDKVGFRKCAPPWPTICDQMRILIGAQGINDRFNGMSGDSSQCPLSFRCRRKEQVVWAA
jgi:hypothetical protein